METSITVADVISELSFMGLTQTDLISKLNRVCRRYIESDAFANFYSEVGFDGSLGYITVPRRFGRIHGIVKRDAPMAMVAEYSQWHEYGWGYQDPSAMSLYGVVDEGYKWPIQTKLPGPGILRLKITNAADVGKTIHVTAPDAAKAQIFTAGVLGFDMIAANPSVDSSQTVSDVEGIYVTSSRFTYPWSLYVVIDGVETLLGTYEPTDVAPRFHRYKLQETTDELRAFCKRVHVPLIHVTDWVWPGNITAIEMGFNALAFERQGNYTAGADSWAIGRQAILTEHASNRTPLRTHLKSEPAIVHPYGGGMLASEGGDYGRELAS